MFIHEIQPNTKRKTKKIVGRGGKRGKTSGRGHKGQRQHGGHGIRPEIRDTIKKLPKLRGYRFNAYKTKPYGINVAALEVSFANGDTVSPTTLLEKGLVDAAQSVKPIKILGNGGLTKKLTVTGVTASKTAIEKIEKTGGTLA